MKTFTVAPFPNEHVFSWLLRMYKLSGYGAFLDYQKSLGITDRFLHANKVLSQTTETLVNLMDNRDDAIKFHTTAPLWQLSIGRILGNQEISLASFVHMSEELTFSFDTYWHSCNQCRLEDLEKYGTTYWHASHQLASIFTCYKHQNFLEKSVSPVRNLFEETLPHDVINWVPLVSAPSDIQRDWQSFYLYMNELAKVNVEFIMTIKTRLFDILELESKWQKDRQEKGRAQSQRLQTELPASLLEYLFKEYHVKSNGRRKFDIVNASLVNVDRDNGERQPIFLVVLAYWQRAALNL